MPTTIQVDALLIDMDGTLVDSTAVVERVWSEWANRHGLNAEEVIHAAHGVPSRQTMRRFVGDSVDIEAEAEALARTEVLDVAGVRAVPGAVEFIASLPPDRWALVTSAGRDLAGRRMAAIGLQLPAVCITADEVAIGKPDPECYRAAARALRVDPRQCLVLEDAPAGLTAGHAAGAKLLGICTTYPAERLIEHHVLLTVPDLRSLSAHVTSDGKIEIRIG
jgi:mannitol-1-/sugar-/sorbitol-6-phosphatase